jgi:hypothetical protein
MGWRMRFILHHPPPQTEALSFYVKRRRVPFSRAAAPEASMLLVRNEILGSENEETSAPSAPFPPPAASCLTHVLRCILALVQASQGHTFSCGLPLGYAFARPQKAQVVKDRDALTQSREYGRPAATRSQFTHENCGPEPALHGWASLGRE